MSPPATYDLRAAYVGYRPVTARRPAGARGPDRHPGLRARSRSGCAAGIEVVGAENPLVPRDEVATTQRVQGDFLEHLPMDRLNDILALQPGSRGER